MLRSLEAKKSDFVSYIVTEVKRRLAEELKVSSSVALPGTADLKIKFSRHIFATFTCKVCSKTGQAPKLPARLNISSRGTALWVRDMYSTMSTFIDRNVRTAIPSGSLKPPNTKWTGLWMNTLRRSIKSSRTRHEPKRSERRQACYCRVTSHNYAKLASWGSVHRQTKENRMEDPSRRADMTSSLGSSRGLGSIDFSVLVGLQL